MSVIAAAFDAPCLYRAVGLLGRPFTALGQRKVDAFLVAASS